MGLFDKLKKGPAIDLTKEPEWPVMVGAPTAGVPMKMEDVPDPVFSQGVLGFCCGVDPKEGKVYAPLDGKVTQFVDSKHAIGLECPGGIELLIHVGVDTVEMNGTGFKGTVKEGDVVAKGQLLLEVDLDKVKAAGHETTVIMAVTNTDDFAAVELAAEGEVAVGEDVLKISK